MVAEQSITGRPRERAKQWVRDNKPHVCHLCGYPIDMNADPHRDPLAFAVDELVPRTRGGSAVDPANIEPAHRWCNGSRGKHPLVPWDPGWPTRTMQPNEVRERCRTHTATLLGTPTLAPF